MMADKKVASRVCLLVLSANLKAEKKVANWAGLKTYKSNNFSIDNYNN